MQAGRREGYGPSERLFCTASSETWGVSQTQGCPTSTLYSPCVTFQVKMQRSGVYRVHGCVCVCGVSLMTGRLREKRIPASTLVWSIIRRVMLGTKITCCHGYFYVCKPEGLTSVERKDSYSLCGKVIKERERERAWERERRERWEVKCCLFPVELIFSMHVIFI